MLEIEQIKCFIDQKAGLHCRFGKEAEAINDWINCQIPLFDKKTGLKTITVIIATMTQLLALDIWANDHNVKLKIFDEDEKEFENITAAHRYVAEEFIKLDCFGYLWDDGRQRTEDEAIKAGCVHGKTTEK